MKSSRWRDAPSASSSAADDTFEAFLTTSFDLLRREVPEALRLMSRRLASRAVLLAVDGERVAIGFEGDEPHITSADATPAVSVVTSRRAILAVIDGDTTLLDAVLDDRMVMRGSPDDLVAFHDGLMSYVHGAVRAPSFRRLLQDFRHAARAKEKP